MIPMIGFCYDALFYNLISAQLNHNHIILIYELYVATPPVYNTHYATNKMNDAGLNKF